MILVSVTGICMAEQVSPEKTTVFQPSPHSEIHSLTHLLSIHCLFLVQGFEWNKYNQTHYDTDNPPPKIVQGYKFNVSSSLLHQSITHPLPPLYLCRFSFPISSTSDKHHPTLSLHAKTTLNLACCDSTQDHLMRYEK